MCGKHKLLLLINLVFTLVMVSCAVPTSKVALPDPIIIQNQTDQTLRMAINGIYIGVVDQGKKLVNTKVHRSEDYLVEAKDTQGNIVYSQRWTRDDIRKAKWKVVVPPWQSK